MTQISPSLAFFLGMAKAQAILTRRFDAGLNGLGLSEFAILYHLSRAPQERMRRSELADRVGLTASGITRLLAPMEKIGLVKREAAPEDARVSYVVLASGGRKKLDHSLEYGELLAQELLPESRISQAKGVQEILVSLGGSVL